MDDELASFCMRCFGINAVPIGSGNFCHNCGSEGTCIELKIGEINYLRENIQNRIKNPPGMISVEWLIEYLNKCAEVIGKNSDIEPAVIDMCQFLVLEIVKNISAITEYKIEEASGKEEELDEEDLRFEGIL